ncbi:hypothetical protein GCM10009596_25260 [Arthrobacter rhombi]
MNLADGSALSASGWNGTHGPAAFRLASNWATGSLGGARQLFRCWLWLPGVD